MSFLKLTKDGVFYTIQGEGKFTGVPTVFVRLSFCNLRCEWLNQDGSTTLCDTPYSSHFPENIPTHIDKVINSIEQHKCYHVVISGGEPFLQKNMSILANILVNKGYFVTVETNGTIYLDCNAQFISISPKLFTSCVKESRFFNSHQKRRYKPNVLSKLINNHDYQIKYVVNNSHDLNEIKEMIKNLESYEVHINPSKIYLMPQGDNYEQIKEKSNWVVEQCKKNGWNFCARQHINIWGSKRSV